MFKLNEILKNEFIIQPEGNIMTDRYKSLQKRNIIEPRERAKYTFFPFLT
jgi:hypothetical protein